MPQNRFIPPTESGRKSVPFAGRRLARTLAPPTSAVDLETLIPPVSWKNHWLRTEFDFKKGGNKVIDVVLDYIFSKADERS
jgi:hypothetical protein